MRQEIAVFFTMYSLRIWRVIAAILCWRGLDVIFAHSISHHGVTLSAGVTETPLGELPKLPYAVY